jgi:hypothetical protein
MLQCYFSSIVPNLGNFSIRYFVADNVNLMPWSITQISTY